MAAHLIGRTVLALLAVGLLAGCVASARPHTEGSIALDDAAAPTRLFLVRHAEKEPGDDPALTPAGEARADALAERLAAEGVTAIWSTPTRRTQSTARPLADMLQLPVQIYDAARLPDFARQLAETPGVILVVGHSNTTDRLAGLLGADPGPPIDEAAEFDRLYVIVLPDGGPVTSEIQRFGQPASLAAEEAAQ